MDIITGGSPCQDLSVAGNRAGLAGERSGLFMEQIRIVKEMRERDRRTGRTGWLVRPRFMVWENVPGAFSSNKGKDFQAVLTEIVKIVEPDAPDVPMPEGGRWSKSGCLYSDVGAWSIAWRVHDAQFWGVPQRRKRIALVADFGGLAAPEILFEREGLSGNLEPGEAEREGTAASAEGSTGEASGVKILNQFDSQGNQIADSDGAYPTLRGCGGAGYQQGYCFDRRIEPTGECLNPWDVQSKHIQTPDGVAESLYAGECRYGGGESYVLDGNPKEPILLESNQNHATIQTDGISTALSASAGMGGGYVPMVVDSAEPVSIHDQATRFKGKHGGKTDGKGNGLGVGRPGDPSPTLSAGDFHAVYASLRTYSNQAIGAYIENDKASALKQRDHKDATDLVVTAVDCRNATENAKTNGTLQAKPNGGSSVNLNNVCRTDKTVRRLTPLECERLQGFPDGWTDIGEWIDSKGKKHRPADSPRYKALGNSIALPFWAWMARRICAQYERPMTMGSLFDGIGGFPLVFERAGAKAVWASEIEEFCVAVTKKHFQEEVTNERSCERNDLRRANH